MSIAFSVMEVTTLKAFDQKTVMLRGPTLTANLNIVWSISVFITSQDQIPHFGLSIYSNFLCVLGNGELYRVRGVARWRAGCKTRRGRRILLRVLRSAVI
ncbi:hypothetical protein DL95DRAFT_387691 [Leptodontidium sp. 2 PMI_412]|nr:hypothetical protein DL95DRAFT_387691 [Leptodontidium sp. 2 PMI_412]